MFISYLKFEVMEDNYTLPQNIPLPPLSDAVERWTDKAFLFNSIDIFVLNG